MSWSPRAPLFDDIFLGGFECSNHRLEDGRRLDLLESTRHRELAVADYVRLRSVGMTAARDGVSWVASARRSGFDFSSAAPIVRAAAHTGVQVVWDLMHFGWPDDLDPFAPSFPSHYARYAGAFAKWLSEESDATPMFAPVNEMSFLAWAGGDVRCMNPFEAARGVEMKAQLVRATIEGIEAIRAACPTARFLQPEPIINIVPRPEHPKTWRRVASDNLLQYQAWDMLRGDVWPTLGGDPSYLDVIGVNFYPDNQFTLDGETIALGDPRHVSLSTMLVEVWRRYGRPMIVSETGSEGEDRAPWLRYVSEQCAIAMRDGCELHGITLYPVVGHPGWIDDRHCQNGLWDYADDRGERAIDPALHAEILRQRPRLLAARSDVLPGGSLAAEG